MAKENILNAKLKIEFDDGFTDSGKQKLKIKQLSNINPRAEVGELLNTGNVFAAFCKRDKLGLKKILESELVEE